MEMNKKKIVKENIKRTWNYAKDKKIQIILYALVSLLECVLSVIIPLISAKVILQMTSGLMEQLVLSSFLIFILSLLASGFSNLKSYFFQVIYRSTILNIQMDVASETLKVKTHEFDSRDSGFFIDRLNNDPEDISSVFMEITFWISNLFSDLGIIFAIFIINKYVFIYSSVVAIILFIIGRIELNREYKIRKSWKKLREKTTSIIGEIIRGMRDIKVLNAEEAVLSQTRNRVYAVSEEQRKILDNNRIFHFVKTTIAKIFRFIFVLYGVFLYNLGLLSIPNFVILYNYQNKINYLLSGVNQLLSYFKKFNLSAERVYEVTADGTFKKEKFGRIKLERAKGRIEFKHVAFAYKKDHPVLTDVSFKIKANETVAFVGKSGAGKSTLFSLITKLYDVDKGEILIDGINIKKLDKKSLRDNMSIITQNPYIFNISIRDNLLLAKPDASEEDLIEACKLSCIHEFIESLDEGYDTILGEGGLILSGGQRQRIAIARALLMKTKIILFDEATSALDNETQEEIQNAIRNMKGSYTILIVAHRLSTVIDSDCIFVLDGGSIESKGTHKELLKTSTIYKNLYKKDLKK